ncbi:MAG: glycosyltransferase [Paludibacter sp.]|nr:glycosyltransferase [Paludibacter sp.]
MMRLSIILPFYNVEKYISECLNSIYAQDIPETEYEVICINDCSPDNSREIVLQYQQKHENLILIEHTENKRVGEARNTGLRAARGKYIWFIDSDDYIAENCLKKLITTMEKNNLDLVFFNFLEFWEKESFHRSEICNFTTEICEGKEVFKDKDCWWSITGYSWRKIMRRSLYFENEMFFYPYFWLEDVSIGARCFVETKKIKYLPEDLYFYRRHSESIMASKNRWEHTTGTIKYAVEFYKIYQGSNDDFVKEFFKAHTKYYIDLSAKKILHLNSKDRDLFYNKLKLITDLQLVFPVISKKSEMLLKHKIIATCLHPLYKSAKFVQKMLK